MTLDEFLARKGQSLGQSEWLQITLEEITTFGAVTHDIEPMHTDPDWCAENSPYGVPIVYGFQTISLLTRMMHSATGTLFSGAGDAIGYPLNYGFNRLRLINPVKVNDRIRADIRLVDAAPTKPDQLRVTLDVTIEIEGGEKPALVAEWIVIWVSNA